MAEVVNLRRFKKAKARGEAAKLAGERRTAFGRTKVEKKSTEAQQDLETRQLDGHKRDK